MAGVGGAPGAGTVEMALDAGSRLDTLFYYTARQSEKREGTGKIANDRNVERLQRREETTTRGERRSIF